MSNRSEESNTKSFEFIKPTKSNKTMERDHQPWPEESYHRTKRLLWKTSKDLLDTKIMMLNGRLKEVQAKILATGNFIEMKKNKMNEFPCKEIYEHYISLSSEQTSITEEIKWSTDMFEKITKY